MSNLLEEANKEIKRGRQNVNEILDEIELIKSNPEFSVSSLKSKVGSLKVFLDIIESLEAYKEALQISQSGQN